MALVMRQTLGVLGGMGPMATVDFLRKLTKATPASCDQEHIPLVVHFSSRTPDRSDALSGVGPSPLPALIESALMIQHSGARGLVIPCNTAHAWYDDVASAVHIPVLHIVDAAVEQLAPALRDQPVGLLATSGTLSSGIYAARHPEIHWVLPSAHVQDLVVMPAIRCVKSDDLTRAGQLLEAAIYSLVEQGARAIILGCTELPLARSERELRVPLIDATDALAHMAVRWAMGGLSPASENLKGL
ncbi:MAG TPA: amino acid racemase [Hydrogenophaga sp.]|nr:amino acid racemase [Hydrogenophaga sp.]